MKAADTVYNKQMEQIRLLIGYKQSCVLNKLLRYEQLLKLLRQEQYFADRKFAKQN